MSIRHLPTLTNRGCFRALMKKSMTTKSPDHLQRTQSNSRQNVISKATVEDVTDLSNTVKKLTLKIHDSNFSFKAGQWVDFFIPTIETVGGYSMCSSPSSCVADKRIDLAVKMSKHPPAYWVHTKCQPGSEVAVRVGGDFYYDPVKYQTGKVLLIAGGVGINPLLSILLQIADTVENEGEEKSKRKVLLLYSASTHNELVFHDDIQKLTNKHQQIKAQYFITRESTRGDPLLTEGRIDKGTLLEAVKSHFLGMSNLETFICGPSPMIDDMETVLQDAGLEKSALHYEKWW